MYLYRKFLRAWLTVASLIGFLLGWVFIAQTIEPENSATATTGETLTVDMPTIPSVDNLETLTSDTGNLQTFNFNQNSASFAPRMRTGGS